MRTGSGEGMSPELFNMSRTDLAGAAMLLAVIVFLAVAIKILRE